MLVLFCLLQLPTTSAHYSRYPSRVVSARAVFGAPLLAAGRQSGTQKGTHCIADWNRHGYIILRQVLNWEHLPSLCRSYYGWFYRRQYLDCDVGYCRSKRRKSKARNFGLIGMAFGLGFILGPFIGGKLADPTIVSWFTNATPFWFAAILSTVNILPCYLAL